MRVCLATYRDRIAVLLENAAEFRFFEAVRGVFEARGFAPRPEASDMDVQDGDAAEDLVRILGAARTDLLVCGGLCPSLARLLSGAGVAVMPWVGGQVMDVLCALSTGDLSRLVLPGCAYEPPSILKGFTASPPRRAAMQRSIAPPGQAPRACA